MRASGAAHISFVFATLILVIRSFSIFCASFLLWSTMSARACTAFARR